MTGIDASSDALEVAGANAVRTGSGDRARLRGTSSRASQTAHGISSSRTRRTSCPTRSATLRAGGARLGAARGARRGGGDGGRRDGAALDVLRPGGALVLEVAAGDAERRRDASPRTAATSRCRRRLDLAGRDRVVEGDPAVSIGRGDDRGAARQASSSSSRRTPSTASRAGPDREEPVRALSALKRRVAGSADRARRGQRRRARRADPRAARARVGRRPVHASSCRTRSGDCSWLTGARPDTIGVRIPDVTGPAAEVLARCRRHRGDEREPPRRPRIRVASPMCRRRSSKASPPFSTAASCPARRRPCSTSTGPEPRVLREGAVPAAEALASGRASSIRADGDRPADARGPPYRRARRHRSRGRGAPRAGSSSAQRGEIELIASENFTWPAMLEAVGSVADEQVRRGLSGPALLRRLRGRRRDRAARDRPREGALRRRARERPAARGRADEHGRLLRRACEPGDTILSLELVARRPPDARPQGRTSPGGSTTIVHYGVSRETNLVDYDDVLALAKEHRPKLIVCGGSAYPRTVEA